MPNHVVVVGLCSRKEYDDTIDFTSLDLANLCELAFPMPKELIGIVSGSEPIRYRSKTTGVFWCRDCNGPPFNERSQWESVPLTSEEVDSLVAIHGHACWYEWCLENWGTKWGAYGTKASVIDGDGSPVLIQFQCAWRPPNERCVGKIVQYLRDNYDIENVVWTWHNPSDGSVVSL